MTPIKHAAIKIGKVVYVGHRHFNVFKVIFDCGIAQKDHKSTQGFVDEEGKFLDRYEALAVAEHFEQVKKKHNPKDQLMSEDIY